jgi:hypothetical protein
VRVVKPLLLLLLLLLASPWVLPSWVEFQTKVLCWKQWQRCCMADRCSARQPLQLILLPLGSTFAAIRTVAEQLQVRCAEQLC